MKRHLLLFLCILFSVSLKAQSDALWMSFGLGGVTARKGLFRADFTATYLRYNRIGGYLDLQANGRSEAGVDKPALLSFSGYGGGIAYNLNPYGDPDQKVIARAGVCYGNGVYLDSVTYSYDSQSGQGYTLSNIYKHNFKSVGLELSVEGMIVLNNPNKAWGFRLIGVINRHPFIGGCLRFNIGAF